MGNTLQIVKDKGEIKNKEFVLRRFENMLGLIANGEHVMTITKQVKKRTLDQNRLMWLWFACIENETGTLKEDIHDYYCQQFLTRKTIINGVEQVIASGTSKLTTIGMKDFLDKVQADAANEFGIKLPSPEDLYWEEFEKHYKHLIY